MLDKYLSNSQTKATFYSVVFVLFCKTLNFRMIFLVPDKKVFLASIINQFSNLYLHFISDLVEEPPQILFSHFMMQTASKRSKDTLDHIRDVI